MIARMLIAWCVAAAMLFLSPPPGSAADFSLKLGVVTPAQHPHSLSAREYAKLVTERTKGRVEVKVFDNASLGSNPELLDGVKTGAIDMCVNTPGIMAEYHPVTGLLELPYLFASKDHRRAVTEGPVGDEIARTYAEKTGIHARRVAAPDETRLRAVLDGIAEATGLTKKQVSSVFEAMTGQISKSLGSRGPGAYTVPGLMKLADKGATDIVDQVTPPMHIL